MFSVQAGGSQPQSQAAQSQPVSQLQTGGIPGDEDGADSASHAPHDVAERLHGLLQVGCFCPWQSSQSAGVSTLC